MRRFVSADWLVGSSLKEPCDYCEKLSLTVHRFDLGARTCRCGRLTVPHATISNYNQRYVARCKGEA